MKKQTTRFALFLVFSVLLAAGAGAQERLLPVRSGDLSATALVAPLPMKSAAIPREPVAVSRALDPDTELSAEEPFTSRSREYWVEVSGADLGRGVRLYNLEAGALVRINPSPGQVGTKKAVDPLAVELVDGKGRAYAAGSGMEQVVTADKLEAAGLPFPQGTTAFRLSRELGADRVSLRVGDLAEDARYVVHVLDAASDVELTLRTLRANYLHGDTLVVEAALTRRGERLQPRRIEGFVSSPAGRAWPVEFRPTRSGTYRARLKLDALETPSPGLWEVQATADGVVSGRAVLRGARTAFAAAVPAAALTGDVEVRRADGALDLRLGLESAAAGRYEVSGVLYGTDAAGELKPAGVARTAGWIEAGGGVLELHFSPEILKKGGLEAPYEVRDLRLADQGRVAVLHQQARALRLE